MKNLIVLLVATLSLSCSLAYAQELTIGEEVGVRGFCLTEEATAELADQYSNNTRTVVSAWLKSQVAECFLVEYGQLQSG